MIWELKEIYALGSHLGVPGTLSIELRRKIMNKTWEGCLKRRILVNSSMKQPCQVTVHDMKFEASLEPPITNVCIYVCPGEEPEGEDERHLLHCIALDYLDRCLYISDVSTCRIASAEERRIKILSLFPTVHGWPRFLPVPRCCQGRIYPMDGIDVCHWTTLGIREPKTGEENGFPADLRRRDLGNCMHVCRCCKHGRA